MKAWRPISPAEAAADPPVYLMRLTYGGRVFRLASRTLHITDAAGDSHVYRGTLRRVDYHDEIDIFSADASRRTIAVEFTLPVDVATLTARGHVLDQARVEILLTVPGRTEEDAVPLLTGVLSEPEIGTGDDPITATAIDAPLEASGMWPPPSWQVTDLTWPYPAPNSVGRWYPTPFGRPGMLWATSGARRRPASRAYLVDTSGTTDVPYALLVAGGHAYLDEVAVYNGDGVAVDSGALQRTTDALGQVVSVFQLDPADLGAPDYSTEWWVAPRPSGPGWGIYGDQPSGAPQRGLGDVLVWALRRSGMPVDWAQVEGQRGRLNRYTVDGVIEQRVNLWQWIQDNILGVYPVWAAGGPLGVRVGIINITDPPSFHLRIPRDGIRDGAPTFDRSRIANVDALRFCLDRTTDHQLTAVQTAEPDATIEHAVPSAYTAMSRTRYGRSGERTIESDLVSDLATATQILLVNARFRGMGVRSISYRCRRRVQGIRAGDVGRLTDGDLGLSSIPVICRRVTPQEADVLVEVAQIVDPIRSPGS